MGQPVIQTSFNSGEWAPSLYGRVDLAKYHAGAALLRNFFIDYRGGATARPGTKFIQQTRFANGNVRLISFQASFAVTYVLEFGNTYIRFYSNGAPVLEAGVAITGVSQGNPAVVSSPAHGYSTGDWVYITGVLGMTQVNGGPYYVTVLNVNTYYLSDVNGTPINSTGFGGYSSGGLSARVYTLFSPYNQNEITALKFTQNVNTMIFCHPNLPPYVLIRISNANWTLNPITFGATIPAPTGLAISTTLGAGTVAYAYVVTAVDAYGQESNISAYATLAAKLDLRVVAGTTTIIWSAVTNAVSYNIYKAEPNYAGAVPAGAAFGFIGNQTGTNFADSNIAPDFSQGPPIAQNPFSGAGVTSVTVGTPGTFGSGVAVPTASFSGGGGGSGAAAFCTLQANGVAVNAGGFGYAINDTITLPNGVLLIVTALGGAGAVSNMVIGAQGSINSGSTPAAPTAQVSTSGTGFGATFTLTWYLALVQVTSPGSGYSPAPTVTISSGGATATATLGAPATGNPTVPALSQQRLILAGLTSNPQQINESQTGQIYNFDIHYPLLPSDAITATLVSGQLNTIQAIIPQPQGLVTLSDKGAWLINGGSAGSAMAPDSLVANPQVFSGIANQPAPIIAGSNILYVQAKASIVRNLVFNFNTQIYTGEDISILSSHLFYGYQIIDWCWAEEPFKLAWAVRNDGNLLSLTFLDEQKLIAWTHSDTAGVFKSIASVTETVALGAVDAVYLAVQRSVNSLAPIYIERFVELYWPNGMIDAWCVDSGIGYNSSPATTFTGAQHLAGVAVTGLADGEVIPPFTMPTNGTFTLAAAASKVVVGIAYTPQLKTLPLDTGEPTIMGKEKKISAVTIPVAQTLGLQIGSDFDAANLVDMADLVIGNIGKDTNELVTDLVTGMALEAIDPAWTVPGQYCIQQSLPYPASILAVIPQITVGDTPK